jgi:hypothetical protein
MALYVLLRLGLVVALAQFFHRLNGGWKQGFGAWRYYSEHVSHWNQIQPEVFQMILAFVALLLYARLEAQLLVGIGILTRLLIPRQSPTTQVIFGVLMRGILFAVVIAVWQLLLVAIPITWRIKDTCYAQIRDTQNGSCNVYGLNFGRGSEPTNILSSLVVINNRTQVVLAPLADAGGLMSAHLIRLGLHPLRFIELLPLVLVSIVIYHLVVRGVMSLACRAAVWRGLLPEPSYARWL